MLEFGKRQKEARRWKRMTQTQLADCVRAHKNTISNIERGKLFPGLLLGLEISECLNVNIRWLAGRTSNPRRGIQLDSEQEEKNYAAYLRMSEKERKQFADFMSDFLHTRAIAQRVKESG